LLFVSNILVRLVVALCFVFGRRDEGPIAVIIGPTRELAEQIYMEARRFAKPFKIVYVLHLSFRSALRPSPMSVFHRAVRSRVTAVFGGMNKHEQFKALKNGCEVVVATPVCAFVSSFFLLLIFLCVVCFAFSGSFDRYDQDESDEYAARNVFGHRRSRPNAANGIR
jgi:hypothetical protein